MQREAPVGNCKGFFRRETLFLQVCTSQSPPNSSGPCPLVSIPFPVLKWRQTGVGLSFPFTSENASVVQLMTDEDPWAQCPNQTLRTHAQGWVWRQNILNPEELWCESSQIPHNLFFPFGEAWTPSQSDRSLTQGGLMLPAGPPSPPHRIYACIMWLLEQNMRFLLAISRQKWHFDRHFSNPSVLFPHSAVSFLRNSLFFIWISWFPDPSPQGEREGFVYWLIHDRS